MLLMLDFVLYFFFFNDTATTEIYTLSLHDALPISRSRSRGFARGADLCRGWRFLRCLSGAPGRRPATHRSVAPGIMKALEITMRMNIGENAQMALTTLRENKMRSFLTVLGVVIGITALLSVVSILVGVYGDVNAYLSDYGSETLFIFRFDPGIHSGRLTPDERARKPLTLEDAEAIAQLCPAVRSVTAGVFPRWEDDGPGVFQGERLAGTFV